LNLPPLIVLIAVLAGAELLGITGVLLALPLAAAGRVAMDYLYEKRFKSTGQQEAMSEEQAEGPLEPEVVVDQPLAPDIPAGRPRDIPPLVRRQPANDEAV
jgi:hypothetical protein